MDNRKVVKQSLLIGALTSSFGVFISKALGLLYYSPLSALAGEENMSFYSITYTYYDLLLKISSAGIPFAIAALVAKYVAKNDYKTAATVKKLGSSLIMSLSLISVIVFIIVSGPLARQSMGQLASEQDVQYLKNLFMILIVAVILVPYLSTLRSYYQGLKRLDLYASSQVLEQFVRVFTILIAGFICIKIINLDSIWAIYMAIAAAGFAALIAIIFFKFSTKKDDKEFNEFVSRQSGEGLSKRVVFNEILSLGIPYLLISFFGTAGPIINTTYFLSHVTEVGKMPIAEAKLSLGIIQANCSKLLAIPQVLTSGFCAGLVPYLTETLEKGDNEKLKKQLRQILDTVLFILVPVLILFFVCAADIYGLMYGTNNIELGTKLFRISLATGFTETVLPILSSIMITLRLKKESVLTLIVCFIIKTVTFFPCVESLWTAGLTLSTCIASVVSMIIYFIILYNRFDISFVSTFKRMIVIIFISLISVLPIVIIKSLSILSYSGRISTFVVLGVFSFIFIVIYYLSSKKTKLFKRIFDIDDFSIKKFFSKFKTS